MALEPDTRLGPYRIVDLLGVGGMGEVYRARDERLNRLVAVKVLPADRVAASAERRSRFIQEAQLASALQHPNIVTIFDIGSTEVRRLPGDGAGARPHARHGHPAGRPAAAERAALRQPDRRRPRRGPRRRHRPPRPQAGQHHGDRAGPDQGPRLRARHAGRGRSHINATDETGARAAAVETGAGTILGTVAYMSPEQAEGHAGRRALRHLLVRRDLLRDAVRPARVPRRDDLRDAGGRDRPRAGAAGHGRDARAAGGRRARERVPAQGRQPARAERVRPEDRARRAARGVQLRIAAGRGAETTGRVGTLRRHRRRSSWPGRPPRGRCGRRRRCRPRSRRRRSPPCPAPRASPPSRPTAARSRSRGSAKAAPAPTSTRRRSGRARRCG